MMGEERLTDLLIAYLYKQRHLWSELYDKVIEEFGKFNRRLSCVRFNSQFLRAT